MKNTSFKLPPWYDNGKYYELVKKFNIFDFFNNLTIRYLISNFLCDEGKFSSQIKNVGSKELKNEKLKPMIKQWLNYPLDRTSKEDIFKYFENVRGEKTVDNSHLVKNPFRDSLFKKTLHPLSWREIKRVDLNLQSFSQYDLDDKEKELLEIHNKNHVSMFNVEKETDTFHEKIKDYLKQNTFDVMYEPICSYLGGFDSYNIQINLDMRSPNSALIRDFKGLLNDLRKISTFDFDRGNESSSVSLGRWVEFKLFEYIDLAIWFAYTDQKVTDSQLGNILFPDEIDKDVTAIIRGSTRKYVDNILTDRFHEKLYWESWVFSDKL